MAQMRRRKFDIKYIYASIYIPAHHCATNWERLLLCVGQSVLCVLACTYVYRISLWVRFFRLQNNGSWREHVYVWRFCLLESRAFFGKHKQVQTTPLPFLFLVHRYAFKTIIFWSEISLLLIFTTRSCKHIKIYLSIQIPWNPHSDSHLFWGVPHSADSCFTKCGRYLQYIQLWMCLTHICVSIQICLFFFSWHSSYNLTQVYVHQQLLHSSMFEIWNEICFRKVTRRFFVYFLMKAWNFFVSSLHCNVWKAKKTIHHSWRIELKLLLRHVSRIPVNQLLICHINDVPLHYYLVFFFVSIKLWQCDSCVYFVNGIETKQFHFVMKVCEF